MPTKQDRSAASHPKKTKLAESPTNDDIDTIVEAPSKKKKDKKAHEDVIVKVPETMDSDSEHGKSKSSSNDPPTKITANMAWIKALPPHDGLLLKALTILMAIVAMACAAHHPKVRFTFIVKIEVTKNECRDVTARGWFLFVSATAWVTTLILTFLYMLNINNAVKCCPCIFLELAHSVLWAILFLIASLVNYSEFPYCEPYVAAAVFGNICTVLYSIAAVDAFRVILAKYKKGNKVKKPQNEELSESPL